MGKDSEFDTWLKGHPRQGVQLVALIFISAWQLSVAVFGMILFLLLIKLLRLRWWLVLLAGLVSGVIGVFVLESQSQVWLSTGDIIRRGVMVNRDLVRAIFSEGVAGIGQMLPILLPYMGWFSLLATGIFATINLMSNSPHEKALRALQRREALEDKQAKADSGVPSFPAFLGNHIFKLFEALFVYIGRFLPSVFSESSGSSSRFSSSSATTRPVSSAPPSSRFLSKLDLRLSEIDEDDFDGTVLGVSTQSHKPVVVPDDHVNQMVLVLGTTGGGKTVTLRRFYHRALFEGYPLIIVDGKPSDENIDWVMSGAAAYGRPFYGFNCGSFDHYDCLAHGGYTELKDKIISLKDEWESDYYRSIAEDYLQTTFEVLIKSNEPFDLKTVVNCLDYEELAVKVRGIDDNQLKSRVMRLESYNRKDIMGLQAHLNLLIHSELGHYFEKGKNGENTFSLSDVIRENGVVYFALPALRFPGFSKVLGKLVINDIKAVIDRVCHDRIFTVFDEFSVFAGDQVLNLVNMGRGKGVHAIFGTQGLADLEKIDKSFSNQVLNCVNTIICHRLNDHTSAEAVSSWIGTKDGFDITAQISDGQGSGMGSVRRNKEFIVHPDVIKQDLQQGEAFYITKVGKFLQDRVKIKYS